MQGGCTPTIPCPQPWGECWAQLQVPHPGSHPHLTPLVLFQGNPLYFQSARNVTVNILNEKTKVLTRLVTGKEGERLLGGIKEGWKWVFWDAVLASDSAQRGAWVSCGVERKTSLHFGVTKPETWKPCWRGNNWLGLSDNQADHRFCLKASPELKMFVVWHQGQEERMPGWHFCCNKHGFFLRRLSLAWNLGKSGAQPWQLFAI